MYTSGLHALIERFIGEMKETFDMSDLGLMKFFPGMEIRQLNEEIFISYKRYVEDLLIQLNMKDCKYVETPMGVNEKFLNDENGMFTDPGVYRSLIGKLLYVVHTRTNICYAINFLSRFMSRPSTEYLGAAKRMVKYLVGTVMYGLFYSCEPERCLESYSDSDWDGFMPDQRAFQVYISGLGPVPSHGDQRSRM